jgi:cytochrome c2
VYFFARALVLLTCALLIGCGNVALQGSGNAIRGQQIFNGEIPPLDEGSLAPRCSECHPVTVGAESALIGNNLSNIGNRAATTVPGQNAYDYLFESIVEPDKYLSGGFQEGIHYREYRQVLSDQDIEDLIAYMLTLQSGQD